MKRNVLMLIGVLGLGISMRIPNVYQLLGKLPGGGGVLLAPIGLRWLSAPPSRHGRILQLGGAETRQGTLIGIRMGPNPILPGRPRGLDHIAGPWR